MLCRLHARTLQSDRWMNNRQRAESSRLLLRVALLHIEFGDLDWTSLSAPASDGFLLVLVFWLTPLLTALTRKHIWWVRTLKHCRVCTASSGVSTNLSRVELSDIWLIWCPDTSSPSHIRTSSLTPHQSAIPSGTVANNTHPIASKSELKSKSSGNRTTVPSACRLQT